MAVAVVERFLCRSFCWCLSPCPRERCAEIVGWANMRRIPSGNSLMMKWMKDGSQKKKRWLNYWLVGWTEVTPKKKYAIYLCGPIWRWWAWVWHTQSKIICSYQGSGGCGPTSNSWSWLAWHMWDLSDDATQFIPLVEIVHTLSFRVRSHLNVSSLKPFPHLIMLVVLQALALVGWSMSCYRCSYGEGSPRNKTCFAILLSTNLFRVWCLLNLLTFTI